MSVFVIILLLALLTGIIGSVFAFIKGGIIARILCGILILILIGILLLFPMSVEVAQTTRPNPAAYQPPTDWSTSNEGESDKPWALDFAQFVNENPNHHWLLAQSPEPCLSVDEAMHKARNQAASQLAETADFSFTDRPSWQFWKPKRITPVKDESLQPRILNHLETSGLIRDRFIQKFERPYGDVWRASLLIDASQQSIAQLNNAITADVTRNKTGLRNTIFSTLGLLAVICGVYYLMDAITKGYFKTRLRILAVGIAIVGVFLLLFLV